MKEDARQHYEDRTSQNPEVDHLSQICQTSNMEYITTKKEIEDETLNCCFIDLDRRKYAAWRMCACCCSSYPGPCHAHNRTGTHYSSAYGSPERS